MVVVFVRGSFRALTQRHFLFFGLVMHFLSGDGGILWQLLALLEARGAVHHVAVDRGFGLREVSEVVDAVF